MAEFGKSLDASSKPSFVDLTTMPSAKSLLICFEKASYNAYKVLLEVITSLRALLAAFFPATSRPSSESSFTAFFAMELSTFDALFFAIFDATFSHEDREQQTNTMETNVKIRLFITRVIEKQYSEHQETICSYLQAFA